MPLSIAPAQRGGVKGFDGQHCWSPAPPAYIGSHTTVALAEAGHEVVSLDNYGNSSPRALERVQRIAGRSLAAVEGDMRDTGLLARLFAGHAFDGAHPLRGEERSANRWRRPLAYDDNDARRHAGAAAGDAGCRRSFAWCSVHRPRSTAHQHLPIT
ncbi:MAG: GDP-mannose 4,6-dehydratase [Burkholderiaceae bacterium]|nr:GDP-mannose 4,6-dehydratase [Burkholderiaceae bacterium]